MKLDSCVQTCCIHVVYICDHLRIFAYMLRICVHVVYRQVAYSCIDVSKLPQIFHRFTTDKIYIYLWLIYGCLDTYAFAQLCNNCRKTNFACPNDEFLSKLLDFLIDNSCDFFKNSDFWEFYLRWVYCGAWLWVHTAGVSRGHCN